MRNHSKKDSCKNPEVTTLFLTTVIRSLLKESTYGEGEPIVEEIRLVSKINNEYSTSKGFISFVKKFCKRIKK